MMRKTCGMVQTKPGGYLGTEEICGDFDPDSVLLP